MSSVIRETRLSNGMKILCLQKDEAQLMYQEVQNYLKYGIGLNQGDTVFDVGANIGLFALYLSDKFNQKIFMLLNLSLIFLKLSIKTFNVLA